MKHISVHEVLPKKLVEEIQKYIQGEYLYVPTPTKNKKSWGSNTQTKKELSERNKQIREGFEKGLSISDLAEAFFLSESTIKRVVYVKVY